ncbi:MAG: T9SS type A sorting domain-containing protein [Candidatus Kapaibacterium sp.]
MRNIYKIVLILLFLAPELKSAVSVEIKPLDESPVPENVEFAPVPYYTLYLRAKNNGVPITAQQGDVFIRNDVAITEAHIVEAPGSEGWQRVRWIDGLDKQKLPESGVMQVIVENGPETGIGYARFSRPNVSAILAKDVGGKQIRNVYFGVEDDSDSFTKEIKLVAFNMFSEYSTRPRVDSITIDSPYFEYEWLGTIIDRSPPPVDLVIGFEYRIKLTYDPPSPDHYEQASLIVHYEGGSRKYINLYAKSFTVEEKTVLNINYPNGNETFTPCQVVPVSWRGSAPGEPVLLEASYNGGKSWDLLSRTKDSVYNWTVPPNISDSVRLRVRQELKKIGGSWLKDDNYPIYKVGFDTGGDKFLTINDRGKVASWDAVDLTVSNRSFIYGEENSAASCKPFGVDYYNDQEIIAGVNDYTGKVDGSFSKLFFFSEGNPDPVNKIDIGENADIVQMSLDSEYEYAALRDALSARVMLYSFENEALIEPLMFEAPVMNFVFSPDSPYAAAALMNGKLLILEVPGFNVINEIDIEEIAVIKEMSFSPDGRFISIGCVEGSYLSNLTDIFIIDINSGSIIRNILLTASDPVGLEFNPTSTKMLIGSIFQPQVIFFDLVLGDYNLELSTDIQGLTDFEVSPQGNKVVMSSTSDRNLYVQEFVFPESDLTDDYFSIKKPDLDITSIKPDTLLLGTEKEYFYQAAICNKGKVPVEFDQSRFENGRHFRLAEPITPDTLYPGECKDIRLIFNPLDTGKLSDELILVYCNDEIRIPVDGRARDWNLTFIDDTYLFEEEVCIGEEFVKEFEIFRNNENEPLTINKLEFDDSAFYINSVADSVIEPGESLFVTVIFRPEVLGISSSRLEILYSWQNSITRKTEFEGKGIGTFVDYSHDRLLFIPEEPQRSLTIINTGRDPVIINNAEPEQQPSDFTVVTPLPITINQGDSVKLDIQWNLNQTEAEVLKIDAVPCLIQSRINLDLYKGASVVTIPEVSSGPLETAVIPVNYENTENGEYKGVRPFRATLEMNPRLFLPESIESSHGSARIISNEVIGGVRYIDFEIEGDFPISGELCRISGKPGLAETDRTKIFFNDNIQGWGKAISTVYNEGLLVITGLCGERRFLHDDQEIQIISMAPNPVVDEVNIEFNSSLEGDFIIDIYDELGHLLLQSAPFKAVSGLNKVTIYLYGLNPGSYRLVIRSGNSVDSEQVIILR